MKTKFNKVLTSLILAVSMLMSSALPAFAAENPVTEKVEVASVNASTTLPAGQHYSIASSIPFTDQKTIGDYYVQGRWLNLTFDCELPNSDRGENGIYITVKILDANTNAVLGEDKEEVPHKGQTTYGIDMTFDLGSFGRNVKILFDASSRTTSNGNYRSAIIKNLTSYVFGA